MKALPIAALAAAAVVSAAQAPDPVSFFESKVRPVLAERCYQCHSAEAKTVFAGLRLDSREAMLKGGDHGPAINPGAPGSSLLIQAIRYQTLRMPPTGKLPGEQIADITRWIEMGAPWPETKSTQQQAGITPGTRKHWAWQPIRAQPGGSIDGFIRAKLAANGLQPSPPAGVRTLIRRLSYDLTGLPPSANEIESFEKESGPEAYTRLVDRLLASPHFGERWARHWMDVARYSDVGFSNVRFPYAFTYRDWLIRAFNSDLPYDRFVMYQLAADQTGDREHLPALGFLTLGLNPPRNTTFPEKMDDRIDVVTRGLLGLTVSCARCHDHKYDPIPTRDYYSLYGIFANSEEVPEPVAVRPDARIGERDRFYLERLRERAAHLERYKQERLEELRAETRQPDQLRRYLAAARESLGMNNAQVDGLAKERNLNLFLLRRWRDWLKSPDAQPLASRPDLADLLASADQPSPHSNPEQENLRLILRGPDSPPNIPADQFSQVATEGDFNTTNNLRWHYDELFAEYAYRGSADRASVLRNKARIEPAYVFVRGNMNDWGEEAPPRFLSLLGTGTEQFRNGRLDLAHAIANSGNPLTARVMVNRVWQHLFGEGLVRSASDFGTRGEPPSHPELLDYLAAQFIADGWSVKRLIRRIVLSDTYRQASLDRADARAKDPENRLLWRANRRRLDFEALRDSMIAASGRLDRRIGGPPFELMSVPSVPRRTVYAYIERERAQALLRSFNVADPEQYTGQRLSTTIPQQALYLMNSAFAGEQARALAERAGDVENLYRCALARLPSKEEAESARKFLAGRAQRASLPADDGPWRYGTGALDPETGRVAGFTPFRYFVKQTWQAASLLPDPAAGRAFLTANGGAPGDDLAHAVVRRWISPADGTIKITGIVNHTTNIYDQRFNLTNGIRAWIISSRLGKLAAWTIDPPEKTKEYKEGNTRRIPANLESVEVRRGDIIDFVVDSRGDHISDQFNWAPVIEMPAAGHTWSALRDFRGPVERPSTAIEELALVMLLSNEFAFVD